MRNRTRARETALQILYQVDLRGDALLDELDELLLSDEGTEESTEFARGLVTGAIEARERSDRLITEAAEHWDISRMAVVDRNILRLAVYEIICRQDIPPKVSINEAIELGKKYSTEQSGSFINGILDRIRRQSIETPGDDPATEG
jgi:transcription antitermination factor NusB